MPQSDDNVIVTGAADCKIRVHDVKQHEILHVFSCHAGRVKRLATVPDQPHLFWSASEDGTIMLVENLVVCRINFTDMHIKTYFKICCSHSLMIFLTNTEHCIFIDIHRCLYINWAVFYVVVENFWLNFVFSGKQYSSM